MVEKRLNQYICLKKDIEDEDYTNIINLEKICIAENKTNLKLELDYKLMLRKEQRSTIKKINEFLYYIDNTLVGYLGISNFGGSAAEISGMIHPDWRRKGIFSSLYQLAKDECKRRGFEKILLLCDDKSESAKEFIKYVGAKYSFSEYNMKLGEGSIDEESESITLRKANNSDGEEIGRQNSIYFGDPNIVLAYPEEEEKHQRITYMIELQGKTIGKIRVDNSEAGVSYICGFGILPEYRGKGYGREALSATLKLIRNNNRDNVYLDVAAENNRALNLYKSCGFSEQAVMNYYEDK